MGNGDSKLLEDSNVNNILNTKEKDKNDLIYAKMTRGQFQEFIKFLEYKKQLLKKKAITNKPHDYKTDQIKNLDKKKQVAGNRNQVGSNKNQVAGNRNQVAGNRNQVAGNRNQVGSNKNQVASNRNQVSSNRNQVGINKNQVGSNRTQVNVNSSQRKDHAISSNIDSFKNNLSNKSSENINTTRNILDNYNNSYGVKNNSCQPRMTSILQNKQSKRHFRDNYESIYQQRQQDLNKDYFTTLKKHGDVDKHQDQFLTSEMRRNQLKYNDIQNLDNNSIKKDSNAKKDTPSRRIDSYKNEIKDFNQQIDPYKLLDVKKTDSLETISKKYRRLALKFHPDRGGNSDAFQALTKAYLSIGEELKKKEEEKSYFDLKKDFNNYDENQNSMPCPLGKGEKFNSNLFNEIYEENKLNDPTNFGYSDWMKSNKKTEKQPDTIFSDKFNINIFNSVFNNLKENETHNQVAKIYEPEALFNDKKGMNFMELGQDAEDLNFTKLNNGGLNYTDYKEAMTKSHLVPKNIENKKIYKNIEELEKSREKIDYKMSDKDLVAYQNIIRKKEIDEESRIHRIRQNDKNISEQYKKINYCLENSGTNLRLTN